MFSSVRNTIISAVMALLLIGSSVAAATGFEAFSFSGSKPSVDDTPSISSSSDSLSDVSGSHSNADDLDSSNSADSDSSSSDDSPSSDSSDKSSSNSSSSSDNSTISNSASVDDGTLAEPVTYDVAEVGTVTVARGDNLLHVTDTTVAKDMEAAGWSVVIERADAIEVEVSFRGPGRVDFKAEIEHGEVRIRVRDRRLEASSSGSSSSGSSNSGDSNSSHSSDSSGQSDSEITQSSPASTDTQTANGVGGTVIVKSTGTELSLGTATPNTGWSMDVRDSGPGRVDVRFEMGNSETHIRFEISGGTVTVKVEERA